MSGQITTTTVNRDRFTKCASCKATADYLISTGATITRIRPGAEPTSRWENGEQVYRDEIKTTAVTFSTCKRHADLNTKRAAAAQSSTHIFDGQHWIEQNAEVAS